MRSAARGAAAAVAFLTRFPLGRFELDGEDVARGVGLFPVVGACLGAIVGLVAVGLEGVFTPFLAATIAIAVELLLTGGIHVDALADTADVLGASSRERALEIMREGPIGAFGAAVLVVDLLAKSAAVAALLDDRTVWLLVAAWAAGRSAPLALASALPYARNGEGSGRALTDRAGRARLTGGVALGLAISVAAARSRSPVLLAGAVTGVVLAWTVARRRLSGVTGDALGAAVEVTTTLALVGAAASV